MFDSNPSYGADFWKSNDTAYAGATLLCCLESLPEPIIPSSMVHKLIGVAPISYERYSVCGLCPLLDTYISVFQELTMPNLDLLLYLLSFFAAFEFKARRQMTCQGLTRKLASVLLVDGHTDETCRAMLFMLHNAYPILYAWSIFERTCAKFELKHQKSVSTTPSEPRAVYATAICRFSSSKEGHLYFRAGERIRVKKKNTYGHKWWVGELRGKDGIFPPDYVTENTVLAAHAHTLEANCAIGEMLQ
jgi:hypothetical protein